MRDVKKKQSHYFFIFFLLLENIVKYNTLSTIYYYISIYNFHIMIAVHLIISNDFVVHEISNETKSKLLFLDLNISLCDTSQASIRALSQSHLQRYLINPTVPYLFKFTCMDKQLKKYLHENTKQCNLQGHAKLVKLSYHIIYCYSLQLQ